MSESRALQEYGILQNRRIFPFEVVQEAFEFKKQYPELFEWAKEQNEKPQLAPQQVVTPDEAVAQQPVPRNPSTSWMKWVSRSETTTVIETHPDGSTVERRRVVQGPSLELQGEACNQATRSLCGAILQEAATGLGFLTSGVGGVLRIAFGAAAAPAPLQIEDAAAEPAQIEDAAPAAGPALRQIEDALPSSGKRKAEDKLQDERNEKLKKLQKLEADNAALSAQLDEAEEARLEAENATLKAKLAEVKARKPEANNAALSAELEAAKAALSAKPAEVEAKPRAEADEEKARPDADQPITTEANPEKAEADSNSALETAWQTYATAYGYASAYHAWLAWDNYARENGYASADEAIHAHCPV